MKLIIQDGPYSYQADWSQEDKIEDGWLKEYYPTPAEVVDAILQLIGCCYNRQKVEEELKERYSRL